jgi:hypothetical protein
MHRRTGQMWYVNTACSLPDPRADALRISCFCPDGLHNYALLFRPSLWVPESGFRTQFQASYDNYNR